MAKDWAKGFYKSRAWQECRLGYIQSVNGLCERCLRHGDITPGYIVHHVEWLTPSNINDPTVTLGWDNLEYVCLECHNQIHMSGELVRDGLTFNASGELVVAVTNK